MIHSDSIQTCKKDIIHYHLNQSYGELKTQLDMDYLLDKYHIFPNETLYVVDCKQAQLESLSKNFSKIIGIDRQNKNDISLLYDHVDESNISAIHHWVMTNLRTAFNKSTGIQVEKDVLKCLYKTFDGRILLKCTTGLVYDTAGAMRYTLGKLTDLTGLISLQRSGDGRNGEKKEKLYQIYKSGIVNE